MTPEEIATRAALAAAATTTAAEAAERALRDADKPLAELQPRPHLEKARELLAGEYERGGLTEYQFITGKGNYDNDPEIRAIEAALALTADINSELEARLAASEARDKVRREALEDAASRFIGYAEMHALKLMDGSITAAERMAIRGKVDRNFTYAYEVRAALAGDA